MKKKDRVFAEPADRIPGFTFNAEVVNVFDDMVERSVPFYNEVQRMSAELAVSFVQSDSRVYDLGCSTGTTLIELSEAISDDSVRFVGLDNSAEMLERCRQKLAAQKLEDRCTLVNANLNDAFELKDASVVIMNYTLQFVRPLHRDALIRKVFDGLREGGCLLISEKIVGRHPLLNTLYIEKYYDMKRRHGYSELEISKKREALENVLIPYKTDENLELLKRNGFAAADVFFSWYNFASFLALKL